MINIIVVDDHQIVRKGIHAQLADCQDIRIIGEAENGAAALSQARKLKPHIVLLDISLPDKSGLVVLNQIHTELPKVKVLIFSTFSEKQYAVRCMKMGASGYLTKQSIADELVDAIRKIANGGKYISTNVAELFVQEIGAKINTLPHETLSDREFEILCLLGKGKSVAEIGELLSTSPSTINTHRAHIMAKMRLSTTAQLIHYVLEHNLIDTVSY